MDLCNFQKIGLKDLDTFRLAKIIGVCQKPYTPFYLTRTL